MTETSLHRQDMHWTIFPPTTGLINHEYPSGQRSIGLTYGMTFHGGEGPVDEEASGEIGSKRGPLSGVTGCRIKCVWRTFHGCLSLTGVYDNSFSYHSIDQIWSVVLWKSQWRCLIMLSWVRILRSFLLNLLRKTTLSSLSLLTWWSRYLIQEWAPLCHGMTSLHVLCPPLAASKPFCLHSISSASTLLQLQSMLVQLMQLCCAHSQTNHRSTPDPFGPGSHAKGHHLYTLSTFVLFAWSFFIDNNR